MSLESLLGGGEPQEHSFPMLSAQHETLRETLARRDIVAPAFVRGDPVKQKDGLSILNDHDGKMAIIFVRYLDRSDKDDDRTVRRWLKKGNLDPVDCVVAFSHPGSDCLQHYPTASSNLELWKDADQGSDEQPAASATDDGATTEKPRRKAAKAKQAEAPEAVAASEPAEVPDVAGETPKAKRGRKPKTAEAAAPVAAPVAAAKRGSKPKAAEAEAVVAPAAKRGRKASTRS